MNRRDLIGACGAALASAAAPRAAAKVRRQPPAAGYPLRPEVAAFLDRLAVRDGLDRRWLDLVVAQGRYCRDAERLTTPARALPGLSLQPSARPEWHAYLARHVDAPRIGEGVAFWHQNQMALARVQQRFGVPPDVVVSILGTETRFGRLTGNYVALDVLLTLSFDYTRRADLYRDELAAYLRLCAGERFDPYHTRSSFAGALGLPQFLPSSVERFGLDFDGDGTVDLHHSVADAAGSIGNYLAAHGWRADQPVALEVHGDAVPAAALPLAAGGLDPDRTWSELAAQGVEIDGVLPPQEPVMLIELPYADADGAAASSFRIGTANFAALLQYNRSYFYATALVEFAAAVRQAITGAAPVIAPTATT